MTFSSKYSDRRNSRSHEEATPSDGKNCKLCRKKLSNEHFLNPKTGLLFSVCDICRKRKRDKYWSNNIVINSVIENKEILQQTAMDTRLSTRTRQAKQQEASTPVIKKKSVLEELPCSSPDLDYSSPSQNSAQPSFIPHQNSRSYVHDSPVQGNLIIVPPYVSSFIMSNLNNPSIIRSHIGDYYWHALCVSEPFKSNL